MISAVDVATASATGSASSLREWQMERVRTLIRGLRGNSQHYSLSLAGIDESQLVQYEDMESLPFTFHHELAADLESFLCVPQKDVARITKTVTSGTTGTPKRFFFTVSDLERTIKFFRIGLINIVGNVRSAVVMLSTSTPYSVGDLLAKALARNGVKASHIRNDARIDEIARAVASADCVVGMPAPILKLCRMYRSLRPSCVLLTADYVPDSIISAVSRLWKCKVFTHYGMTETGYGCAVQCEVRMGHHIRHSEVLVEIVDPTTGKQMPLGHGGEIVVTTFAQEAIPLLRYRTGDISSETAGACPCGGMFPMLGKIMGRVDNLLSSGLTLAGMDEIVFDFDEVLGYHVKVGSDETLLLNVEASKSLDKASFENAVRSIIGDANMFFSYDYSAPLSTTKKRAVGR
jgi:phenylacetate-coenzyme A ligase PaaK-like adenylate-forming protein